MKNFIEVIEANIKLRFMIFNDLRNFGEEQFLTVNFFFFFEI